jgi:NAD(P)-dependent dehydrogenase (short-subunit alcohol dehydrogenase family)
VRGDRRRLLTAVADVRDDAAVSAAVDAAVATFGRIDVLFNNAGICAYGLAHELTETEWDTMLDINLKGPWIVARRVIPHMIAAGRGVIVNNSSVAGLRGMGRLSHYAASKWGLTGLTKSWAIELAPHGIRVVAIHPTGVDTPLNDGLAELEGSTPLEIAERSAGNLLPVPWIEAEDVAEAVLYLISDKARFMTGLEPRARCRAADSLILPRAAVTAAQPPVNNRSTSSSSGSAFAAAAYSASGMS